MAIWDPLRKVFDAGVDTNVMPNEEVVRVRILNVICVVAVLVITVMYSLRDLLFGRYSLAFFHYLLVGVFVPPILLNHFRRYAFAVSYLFLLFPLALIPYNYFLADIGSENYLFSLVLLGFLIIPDATGRIAVSIYSSLVFILIKVMLRNGWHLNEYADFADELFYFNTTQSFVLVTAFSYVYAFQNRQQLIKIEDANSTLKKNNHLIRNLLRELNHRVKNNLQMISSMFNLQSAKAHHEEVRTALADAQNRVLSLAAVYGKLYSEEMIFRIRLADYIRQHVSFLVANFPSGQQTEVQISIDEDLQLSIEKTVHVGLIINELITNISKYGLVTEGGTFVSIGMKRAGDSLEMAVEDNGPGFPEDFKWAKQGSFGYELIYVLADKYGGLVETSNNPGALIELSLKLWPDEEHLPLGLPSELARMQSVKS